jgi:hypothetical protein
MRSSCRQTWPMVDDDSDAIRIRYQAGLAATGEDVPEAVRQWLRFRVASCYQFREQFVSGQVANLGSVLVDSLLHAYQVSGGGVMTCRQGGVLLFRLLAARRMHMPALKNGDRTTKKQANKHPKRCCRPVTAHRVRHDAADEQY